MRILWLKTEVLHPVDKGGKIRSYNMLKELKRNCHVTYLTLDDGPAAPRYTEARLAAAYDLTGVALTGVKSGALLRRNGIMPPEGTSRAGAKTTPSPSRQKPEC